MSDKPKSSNAPYLIAVVVMFAIAVTGTVALEYLRPDKDNTILTAVIIGVVTSSTPAILGFMKAQEAVVKADEAKEKAVATHILINSRMDELLAQARLLALAEGEKTGRENSEKRTDMLAEQSKTGITE